MEPHREQEAERKDQGFDPVFLEEKVDDGTRGATMGVKGQFGVSGTRRAGGAKGGSDAASVTWSHANWASSSSPRRSFSELPSSLTVLLLQHVDARSFVASVPRVSRAWRDAQRSAFKGSSSSSSCARAPRHPEDLVGPCLAFLELAYPAAAQLSPHTLLRVLAALRCCPLARLWPPGVEVAPPDNLEGVSSSTRLAERAVWCAILLRVAAIWGHHDHQVSPRDDLPTASSCS
jgi:hypothetical protein